jgi:hypothetical protein
VVDRRLPGVRGAVETVGLVRSTAASIPEVSEPLDRSPQSLHTSCIGGGRGGVPERLSSEA